MNRWVAPLIVVAGVSVGLLGVGAVPPQPVPSPVAELPTARSSLVCPSFSSETTTVRVAATAVDGPLFTSRISRPDLDDEVTGVKVLSGVAEPVRVSAAGEFGATTVAQAPSGTDRGLSAVSCLPARSQWWFSGVQTSGSGQAELVLANLDSSAAAVDVTVWAEAGRLATPGSRGILVEGHSWRRVSLGSLVTQDEPVSVAVDTSQGRVAAFVRVRRLSASTSGEWVPPTVAPGTSLVIPGIPAGPGRRDLVVTNPGQRTASIPIALLGEGGRTAMAGLERIDLPPGATRRIEVTAGLAEQAAALLLTSEQPVTAAVLVESSDEVSRSDPLVLPAATPVVAGVWPFSAGRSAETVLHMANPGPDDASVSLTVSDALGSPGTTNQVDIAAGSSATVDVAGAATSVVRLADVTGSVHAALVIARNSDGVQGLAGVTLAPATTESGAREVAFDPLTGT